MFGVHGPCPLPFIHGQFAFQGCLYGVEESFHVLDVNMTLYDAHGC